jgi:hypothetical protein
MSMAGFIEMCVRQHEGATKKILPVLAEKTAHPPRWGAPPFYAQASHRRRR